MRFTVQNGKRVIGYAATEEEAQSLARQQGATHIFERYLDVASPPLTHPNIVSKMRAVPPPEPFNEAAALARMERITFLRSLHQRGPVSDPALSAEWAAHNARVAQYSAVRAPTPPAVPVPLSVVASVPQAPRPAPIAPVQPTPALAGISNRAAMLQNLLARPAPSDDHLT
jgi:hypothetical protein